MKGTIRVYLRALIMLFIAVSTASCATLFGRRTVDVGIKSFVGEQGVPQAVDLVWVYDTKTAERIDGVADSWFSQKQQFTTSARPCSFAIQSYEIVPQQMIKFEWEVRGRPKSFFLFVRSAGGPAEDFARRYDGKAVVFKKIEITLRDSDVDVSVE